MTKDTQNLGVMPDVHKRVQHERDELRTQNGNLQLDLEHLRADLATLAKERDALRLAWETLKRERDKASGFPGTPDIGTDAVQTEEARAIEREKKG